jgi:hypothetical protein
MELNMMLIWKSGLNNLKKIIEECLDMSNVPHTFAVNKK